MWPPRPVAESRWCVGWLDVDDGDVGDEVAVGVVDPQGVAGVPDQTSMADAGGAGRAPAVAIAAIKPIAQRRIIPSLAVSE